MFKRRVDFENLNLTEDQLSRIFQDSVDYYTRNGSEECSWCKETLEDDWNYCPYCGTPANGEPNPEREAYEYFESCFKNNILPTTLSREIPWGWDELELSYNTEWHEKILNSFERYL